MSCSGALRLLRAEVHMQRKRYVHLYQTLISTKLEPAVILHAQSRYFDTFYK